MGILHPGEQNFHPAKCSTIFNRSNIWEQAPREIERTWKRSLVCADPNTMFKSTDSIYNSYLSIVLPSFQIIEVTYHGSKQPGISSPAEKN